MLSEEEKQAISRLKLLNRELYIDNCNLVNVNDLSTVLNLITKLQEESELQKENYKNLNLDVSRIAIELGLEEDATIDEIYSKIKEKGK